MVGWYFDEVTSSPLIASTAGPLTTACVRGFDSRAEGSYGADICAASAFPIPRKRIFFYKAAFDQDALPIFWVKFSPPIDLSLSTKEQVEQLSSNGRMHEVSEGAAKLFGSSAAAMRGSPSSFLWQNDSSDESAAANPHCRNFVENGYHLSSASGTEAISPRGDTWLSISASGRVRDGMLTDCLGAVAYVTKSESAAQAQAQAQANKLLDEAQEGLRQSLQENRLVIASARLGL